MKKISFKLIALCFSYTIILFGSLLIISHLSDVVNVSNSLTDYNRLTIILDAGHGGEDGGAVAADGSLEKHYNLDIAKRLEKILILYGFNVIMTRTEDKMTCDDNLTSQRQKKISDIRNRLNIIESTDNSIFVSIHQNNFNDPSQKGIQVFYSKNNFQSRVLAESIQNSVVSSIQINNKRKVKKSGTEIYLLYHSEIPSVMVECGFLSNPEDLSLLDDECYKQKLSMCIADGILKFVTLNR